MKTNRNGFPLFILLFTFMPIRGCLCVHTLVEMALTKMVNNKALTMTSIHMSRSLWSDLYFFLVFKTMQTT